MDKGKGKKDKAKEEEKEKIREKGKPEKDLKKTVEVRSKERAKEESARRPESRAEGSRSEPWRAKDLKRNSSSTSTPLGRTPLRQTPTPPARTQTPGRTRTPVRTQTPIRTQTPPVGTQKTHPAKGQKAQPLKGPKAPPGGASKALKALPAKAQPALPAREQVPPEGDRIPSMEDQALSLRDQVLPDGGHLQPLKGHLPIPGDQDKTKQILVLGLDGAGKTSVLHSLASNKVHESVVPTQGSNTVCINTEDSQMEFLEIGGSEPFRSYWEMYLSKGWLLIFVVDSADHNRLPEAKKYLHQLIGSNPVIPLVVFAHKQDLQAAYHITDIHEALALSEVGNERKLFLFGTQVTEKSSEMPSTMQDAKDLIAHLAANA